MATHSSTLAWRIPGTAEPGGLPSLGSHTVGHDWSDLAAAAVQNHFLKTWKVIWGSLVKDHLSVLSVWDGEGNGNPLQYSCLEDPMDLGVAESDRTERLHFHFLSKITTVGGMELKLEPQSAHTCASPDLHHIGRLWIFIGYQCSALKSRLCHLPFFGWDIFHHCGCLVSVLLLPFLSHCNHLLNSAIKAILVFHTPQN